MSEFLTCKQNKDTNDMLRFLCFWILVCVVFVLLYVYGLAPTKKGELTDPDCYMRLIRVSELYNTGRWYDPVISRSNAPYGDRLHWTRPFDILLLLGAVPLALFTDFESALFCWGVIISPVLMIATIVALQWSIRPILNEDGPFLASFVFVCQIIIFAYFQPGRPDHHSLLIFFFVLSIGLTLRMILRPFSVRLCYMAGMVSALSIWVSVESMVSVSITLGVLGLLWLLENEDFLEKNLHYTFALFVVTGLSLVLERAWHSVLAEEYDRLSIVHLSVIGFITVLWITIYVLNHHTQLFHQRANRVMSIPIGIATLALAIFVSFPKFYRGPYVDVDPRMITICISAMSELKPLLSGSEMVIPVQLFGSAVLCFPFLCYLILKEGRNENRKGWIFMLLAPAIFILISLYQIRWSVYCQVFLAILMAKLMVWIRQRGPMTGFLKTLKNVFIVLIFCSGFLFLGLLADAIFKKGDSEKSRHEVSLVRICEYLTDAEKWQQRSFRILTHFRFGSEILYRTHHEVVANGFHRSAPGILDTYETMTADTDERALKLMHKRGIDLILLCPKSTESAFYSKPGQTSTFYQRLLENMIPNWLRKVELPSDLSSSFLLFETIEKSNSHMLTPNDPISIL